MLSSPTVLLDIVLRDFQSSITLVECVSNFLNWTGVTIPEAIETITSTPAKMLGLASAKGTLSGDADADIVVLSEDQSEPGHVKFIVDQVWKFGVKVHDRQDV